ncbi:MAG TPA: response regulator transcription factor [Terriglobia bacterium]|nr:response regulator transcription factor [Terriglobia bacterium]
MFSRIGIVSSQTLMRKGLLALLYSLSLSSLSVVVEASTVSDASEEIIATKPAILLIDCEHCLLCFNWIRYVGGLSPSTKCLLLTDEVDEKFEVQAVRSGAWGVVSKRVDPMVMRQAIDKIARGQMWFTQEIMAKAVQTLVRRKPVQNSTLDRLTPRETEVLVLLSRGFHNKQIASRLFLSASTVRTYIEAIYRKTGVKTRVEAALRFYEFNGVQTPAAGSSAKSLSKPKSQSLD